VKKQFRHILETLTAIAYLVVAVGVINIGRTKFETVVLAGMVQLYAAVLYSFSLIGVTIDVNNRAGFVRFMILAAAQGITENEDGTFEDQEKGLVDVIEGGSVRTLIYRLSHTAVSMYALFKIVLTVFF
jgi:hypothetical protein